MFVSLQFKLELKRKDKQKLIKLMRKQSSAIRMAYNMLKELEKEKAKNPHSQIYHRLRQLFPDLPTKYIDSAIYKAKQYPKDKIVVFGGKRLFEKLCKKHLTGKARERLKKQWRELRQGTLIAIGSKHKTAQGNLLLRLMELDGKLHLRITKGNREFIYARVLRESSNSKDKGNLKKLKKGTRGDGKAELRKRLHQWNAEKFLQKLKRVAMLKGVEVVEVNPAYTSVIGMLKYAPQLNIDKDVAGAYVIGRRALGFKEDMPKNYEKLLKDKAYLEFSLKRYEEREKELRELLEEETNQYKRNALESELKNVEDVKKLLVNLIQSLQSESSSCKGANGRNSKQGRVAKITLQSAWQVLKVALLFPILGKVLPRDLSPLKPVLVEGVWDRVRRSNGLVPLETGGTVPIRDF